MEGQINKRFITLEEAAAIVAAGGDVKMMRESEDWQLTLFTTFRSWLEGMAFMVDVLDETVPAEEPAKQEEKQEPKKAEAKTKKPHKGGRRARDWDEARILDMYASGATLEAIAKEMNCTTAPIRKIVAKVYADANGKLPRGSKREIKHEIDTGKIGALYAAGWSIKDIAGEMHMETADVSKILEKMGRKAKADEVSEG